jgi:hypothetical protein
MADTGLPWELPYPLPTDLVRDGADAIKDLAEATASGLDDLDTAIDNIPVLAGIGSNVVQAVKTNTQASGTGGGGVTTVAGLTCTITPTSASSKLLIIVNWSGATSSGSAGVNVVLLRNATAVGVGGVDGSRRQVTFGGNGNALSGTVLQSGSGCFLDSPSTTSSVSYTIQIHNAAADSRTLYVNRSAGDGNSNPSGRSITSITAIEVAA